MNPTNIISTIGRSPVTAAPTAAPMNPDSLIGVSSTRSRPNSLTSPLVTPRTPPQASSPCKCSTFAPPATSSPIRITRGSRRISWRIASFSAWLKLSCRSAIFPSLGVGCWGLGIVIHIDIGIGFPHIRERALLGELYRCLDLRSHAVINRLELSRADQFAREHIVFEQFDWVALFLVLFVLCGNFIRLLVSLVVTVEAVGLALEQSRAFASSRPSDRLTRGLIHGEDVVTIHGDAGHIIGCGAVSDVLDATVILRRRRLGVAVILGDEDHRQLPDCSQ